MTMTDNELLQTIAPALKGIGELSQPTYLPTDTETSELVAAFIRVLQIPRVHIVDEGTKRLMSEISPVIARIQNLEGKAIATEDQGGLQR